MKRLTYKGTILSCQELCSSQTLVRDIQRSIFFESKLDTVSIHGTMQIGAVVGLHHVAISPRHYGAPWKC